MAACKIEGGCTQTVKAAPPANQKQPAKTGETLFDKTKRETYEYTLERVDYYEKKLNKLEADSDYYCGKKQMKRLKNQLPPAERQEAAKKCDAMLRELPEAAGKLSSEKATAKLLRSGLTCIYTNLDPKSDAEICK